ncbi:MAG: hypothetical protein ACQESX_01980 [Bacteroidota bacterium]
MRYRVEEKCAEAHCEGCLLSSRSTHLNPDSDRVGAILIGFSLPYV